MNERYYYLLLDMAAISVPLIASFYPKAPFIKTFRGIIPALVIPMIVFIAWDVWFTDMGVWGFNPRYLSGIYLFNLPIEEWLFFISIPYACLFTYFAIKHFWKAPASPTYLPRILAIASWVVAFVFKDQWYTFTTFLGLGMLFYYIAWREYTFLFQFFVSYLIILIPFFLINGVLTGSWIDDQVVWYNDAENWGIRMGTIPMEDAFYGMFLLLWNTLIWERISDQQG